MQCRMLIRLAVVLVAFVMAPVPGWAVVGTLNVTVTDGNTGQPVPNATVTLETETKTTDQDGRVTFVTEEGHKTIRITQDGYRTTSRPLDVPPGGTVNVTEGLRPMFPWMVQNPGGFGIAIGGGGFTDGRQRFKAKALTDKVTTGGTTTTSVQDQPFLSAISSNKAFASDVSGGIVPIVLGVPGLRLPAGAGTLHPAVEVGIGGTHVEWHNGNSPFAAVGGSPFQLSGTGLYIETSGHLLWQAPRFGLLGGAEPFAEVGGGYAFIASTDLDRETNSPQFTDHFGWDKWYVEGRAGVSLWQRRVAPYAGIRYTEYSVNVDSHFSPVPGTTVDRGFSFAGTRTEGIVGVDVRLFSSFPLFARGEARFSSDAVSGLLKLMLSFDP